MTFDEVLRKSHSLGVYIRPSQCGKLGTTPSRSCKVAIVLGVQDPESPWGVPYVDQLQIGWDLDSLHTYCDSLSLDHEVILREAKLLKEELIKKIAKVQKERDQLEANKKSLEEWRKELD